MTDLFGTPFVNENDPKKRKAEIMHEKLLSVYGTTWGEKCKDCAHLGYFNFGKKYYKCTKTKYTNSESTDWRVNWQACGLFE